MLFGVPQQYCSLVCEDTDWCCKQRSTLERRMGDQLGVTVPQHCFKPVHTQTRTIPVPCIQTVGTQRGALVPPNVCTICTMPPVFGCRGQYRGTLRPDLTCQLFWPEPAFTVSAITIKLLPLFQSFALVLAKLANQYKMQCDDQRPFENDNESC